MYVNGDEQREPEDFARDGASSSRARSSPSRADGFWRRLTMLTAGVGFYGQGDAVDVHYVGPAGRPGVGVESPDCTRLSLKHNDFLALLAVEGRTIVVACQGFGHHGRVPSVARWPRSPPLVMLALLVLPAAAEAVAKRGTRAAIAWRGRRAWPTVSTVSAARTASTGGGGNDVLRGGAGDDRLRGGGGNDLLVGGAARTAHRRRRERSPRRRRRRGPARRRRRSRPARGRPRRRRLHAADGVRDELVCGPGLTPSSSTGWTASRPTARYRTACPWPLAAAASASCARPSAAWPARRSACQVLPFGTSLQLTPEPAEGSLFAGWRGDCAGSADVCALSLTADANATALFALRQVPVAVERTGSGSGRVVTQPALVDCGDVCGAVVGWGAALDPAATPDPGSVFAGWSGDCFGAGEVCTLVAHDDVLVVGRVPAARAAAGAADAAGRAGRHVRSEPAGVDCTAAAVHGELPPGAAVRLTATPAAGLRLRRLERALRHGAGRICTITSLTVPVTVGRVVQPRGRSRSPRPDNLTPGSGWVVSSEAAPRISCQAVCAAAYPVGTTATLTFVTTWGTVQWTGCAASTATTCTVRGRRADDDRRARDPPPGLTSPSRPLPPSCFPASDSSTPRVAGSSRYGVGRPTSASRRSCASRASSTEPSSSIVEMSPGSRPEHDGLAARAA